VSIFQLRHSYIAVFKSINLVKLLSQLASASWQNVEFLQCLQTPVNVLPSC